MSQYDDRMQALGVAVAAKAPTVLWGPPGQGKSSVLESIANGLGRHIETLIPSAQEPTDFSGLPEIVDATVNGTTVKATQLIAPGWALRVANAGGDGLVFFDELSNAPDATQAVVMNVILTRRIGEFYLGDNVAMVCAANPTDQAANGWELALPLKNRLIHLDWDLPASVVAQGLVMGFPEVPVPQLDETRLDAAIQEARVLIGSFLDARADMVTRIPQDNTEEVRGFPTPRSWEMAAKLYGYSTAAGVSRGARRLLLNGTVGEQAVGELLTYIDNLDLPDPETLLADPTGWKVPPRGDQVYAVGMSVLSAIKQNMNDKRWVAAGRVWSAFVEAGHSEIAVVTAKHWMQIRPNAKLIPDKDSLRVLAPVMKQAGILPNAK